jgi:hypothetical protein
MSAQRLGSCRHARMNLVEGASLLRGEAELVGKLHYMRRPWITVELAGQASTRSVPWRQREAES